MFLLNLKINYSVSSVSVPVSRFYAMFIQQVVSMIELIEIFHL